MATTRQQHLVWCKRRAIDEMKFYNDGSKGIISMMSDLRKHPETNSETLIALCAAQLLGSPKISIAEAMKFIDGFN
jgi:hypothetical protein